MTFDDTSVEKYGVGSALCCLCGITNTSLFNYGQLIYKLQRVTGLTHGYVCDYCDNKSGDKQ